MRWGLTRRNNDLDTAYNSFRNELDRFFDDYLSPNFGSLTGTDWVSRLDIDEDEKSYHVSAELPGMKEKDIDVSLEENVLTISGEKGDEKKEKKNGKRYVTERHYGSFSRSVTLPRQIKADDVKAEFKDGVLEITIPKDEKANARKIPVHS
jgi:HSP20 family protein